MRTVWRSKQINRLAERYCIPGIIEIEEVKELITGCLRHGLSLREAEICLKSSFDETVDSMIKELESLI